MSQFVPQQFEAGKGAEHSSRDCGRVIVRDELFEGPAGEPGPAAEGHPAPGPTFVRETQASRGMCVPNCLTSQPLKYTRCTVPVPDASALSACLDLGGLFP